MKSARRWTSWLAVMVAALLWACSTESPAGPEPPVAFDGLECGAYEIPPPDCDEGGGGGGGGGGQTSGDSPSRVELYTSFGGSTAYFTIYHSGTNWSYGVVSYGTESVQAQYQGGGQYGHAPVHSVASLCSLAVGDILHFTARTYGTASSPGGFNGSVSGTTYLPNCAGSWDPDPWS